MNRIEQSDSRAGSPVKLHIEELLLHGFAAADRRGIAHALQADLTRLISEAQWHGPHNSAPIDVERLRPLSVRLKPGATPQSVGSEVARALFRSLQQYTSVQAPQRPVQPPSGGGGGKR